MDYKVSASTFIDFQQLLANTTVVASRQFGVSSRLAADLALKKTDEHNLKSTPPVYHRIYSC